MNKNKIKITILICTLLILFQYPLQAYDTDSKIYIKPENTQVSQGETFNVTIYCEPIQHIKAFEFDLEYDEKLIQANAIHQGDIFQNYSTWFNAGTIDNSNGYIDNIYCLIMENKTVINPGSLATISFTARTINGTSTLHLNDTGISNETDYIEYTIKDGTIIIGGNDNPPVDPNDPINHPPLTPNKPSGINLGYTNIAYWFISTTSDQDNDQIEYLFDWGDGTKEIWVGSFLSYESISYSHLWEKPGIYEIRVKAKDNNSQSGWSSPLTVAIENQEETSNNQTANKKPIADFSYSPNNPTTKDIIEFTDLSYDIDGVIIKWLWNFGDGSTSELQNPTHTFQNNNSYIITLTIWDNNNSINVSQKEIKILEDNKKINDNSESETPSIGIVSFFIALLTIIIFIRRKI